AQKKAADEARRWRLELAAIERRGAQAVIDDLADRGAALMRQEAEQRLAAATNNFASQNTADAETFRNQQGFNLGAQLAGFGIGKKKGPVLLEQLGLDKPEELNLALTAVQTFTSGYTQALEAFGSGTLSA